MRYGMILVPLACVSFAQHAKAESECRELLKGGVFDSADLNVNQHGYQQLATWACQNRSSSNGGSLGFSTTNIVEGLGYNGSAEQQSEWLDSFCSTSDFSAFYSNIDQSRFRTASSALINGFNSCLSSTRPGVWISYTPGASTSEFVLRVGFNPVGGGIMKAEVRLQNANEAGCESGNVPREIEAGARVAVICNRRDGAARTIALNSNVTVLNDSITIPQLRDKQACSGVVTGSGLSVRIPVSPCVQTATYDGFASFRRRCDGASEAAIIRLNVAGTITDLYPISDNDFDTASFTDKMKGSVRLEPTSNGSIEFTQTHTHCSNPDGPMGVKVTFRETL